jgi:hypothetical protein
MHTINKVSVFKRPTIVVISNGGMPLLNHLQMIFRVMFLGDMIPELIPASTVNVKWSAFIKTVDTSLVNSGLVVELSIDVL